MSKMTIALSLVIASHKQEIISVRNAGDWCKASRYAGQIEADRYSDRNTQCQ